MKINLFKKGFQNEKMKKRKGVSPVIATVLLVAMVIALALIVFIWMRSFVKETVTKFEGENIELSCEKLEFQASYSEGVLSVSNTGNTPIYDFKVKTGSGGSYSTESLRDNEIEKFSRGLNPGDAVSISINNAVELMPVLLGTSDKGRRTFTCENKIYSL